MKTVILIEIIDVLDELDATTTLYWSNSGFVTQSGDTPANQYYDPCIKSDIVTNEKITIDSEPNISFSDIVIFNEGKEEYLNYTWKGREVNIYSGEINQNRSSFTLIYTGIIEGLTGNSYTTYKLTMSDKMEKLNKPITEVKLVDFDSGTYAGSENDDQIVPLTFGEVNNIQGLLADPVTQKYILHQKASESVLEGRDYGYPLKDSSVPVITNNNTNGTVATLQASPAGTITFSFQGDKRGGTYLTSIADIIEEIVTEYGVFTASDIDSTNFSTFNSAHTQQVSYYVDSNENILTIIQYLADAIEAQVYINRLGKMSLYQLDFGAASTLTLTNSDIKEHSIYVTSLPELKAGIKLKYCENHTPQQDLQTGIDPEHKDLWAKDFLTVSSIDETVATKYNLETEVEAVASALINETEAQAEADRRLAIWKVQRYIYKATIYRTDLTLGQTITYDGNDYVVLGLNTNWTKGTTEIEVIR